MKVKRLYFVLFLLMLVCVAVTAVFLILLPDRVPVHWNFAGQADRIGSKYENLIWAFFALGMGGAFLLIARHEGKKNGETNERIMLYAAVVTLLTFTILGVVFMGKGLKYDGEAPSASAVSADAVFRVVSVCIGVLLAVLGNYLPKVRKNNFVGLRVKWSMANDAVWQRSQRFCGISGVIAGLVLILSALFLRGAWNLAALAGVMAVWLVLNLLAARRYWLEARERRAADGGEEGGE